MLPEDAPPAEGPSTLRARPGSAVPPSEAARPNTVQLAVVMKWAFSLRAKPALDCGGSTPPGNNAEDDDQGGVEPPQSKALRACPYEDSR